MERSLKRQAIRRNIRFWGKQGEQMFLMMVGMIAIYSIFFQISIGKQAIWENALYYMIMMGLIFAFLLPSTNGGSYFPLVLSFGSKRREAVWGMQLMNLLFAVQYLLAVFFCRGFQMGFSQELFSRDGFSLGIYAAIIVFTMAMGQLTAAARMKFEKKGVWIMMAGIAVIIAGGTGAGVLAMNAVEDTFWQIKEKWSMVILCGGALTAAALYVVSVMVLLRVVQKYEVRA